MPNPLASRSAAASQTAQGGAPVVLRGDQLAGYVTSYTHGTVAEAQSPLPAPPRSSAFQPLLTWLAAYRSNGFLWRPGQIALALRNNGVSFRAPTIQGTGNPTSGAGRMQAKPAFTRVQQVRRYPTAPKVYNTRSAKP